MVNKFIIVVSAYCLCIFCNFSAAAPVFCATTGSRCITAHDSSCRGLADGDYQACEGCTFYHSCVAGYINYSFRDCPKTNLGGINGKLVWDDVLKRCEYESNTCTQCNNGGGPVDPDGQTCSDHQRRCLPEEPDMCRDQLDGDYQSCSSCHQYISCKDGQTWLNRPCPFDSQGKLGSWVITGKTQGYCSESSETCNNCPIIEKCTTGKGCVEESASTCASIADGDYQSCSSCHVYLSCKDGMTWSRRPCPFDNNGNQQVWTITGPTQGHCTSQSSTCNECPITPNPLPPVDCSTTGAHCISESSQSCRDRADGHYQACEGCTIYHSCSGGVIWPNRLCPLTYYGGLDGRLVWVQVTPTEGRCDYTSTTCHGQGCSGDETTTRAPTSTPVQTTTRGQGQCTSTGSRCITAHDSSCRGLADGDYQACEGCTFYHSCVAGSIIYSFRDCPKTNLGGLNGKLVWDDVLKRCEYESNTCTQCDGDKTTTRASTPAPLQTTTRGQGLCTSTGSRCITAQDSSCRGLADGDYQACEGCTFYHSCVAGSINYSFRDCPKTNLGGLNGKLVWDDVLKRCEYESNTCTQCDGDKTTTRASTPALLQTTTRGQGLCTSTGSRCITAHDSSCRGLADGDYQACEGCTFYHSCVAGSIIYLFRDCPKTNLGGLNGKLVWDDVLKRCEYESNTCTQCDGDKTTTRASTTTQVQTTTRGQGLCTSTGSRCITAHDSSCRGLADGDYQACEGCTFYHSCVAGSIIYSFRDCPKTNLGGLNGKLVWDDVLKRCEYESNTCTQCDKGDKTTTRASTPALLQTTTRGQGLCTSTGSRCITAHDSSCRGLADGDYQACEGCTFYHSCVAGSIIYSFRDCPKTNLGGLNGKLVWDDVLKRCEYESNTCTQCDGDKTTTHASTPAILQTTTRGQGLCTSTGSRCITAHDSSCRGLADGDYQACEGCTFYHSCVAGSINYPFRDCPKTNYGGLNGKLVWDDVLKRCEYESNTCTQCDNPVDPTDPIDPDEKCSDHQRRCLPEEPDMCRDQLDGDYQSCSSCHQYISCKDGQTWLNRPCPLDSQGKQGSWVITGKTQGYCSESSETCNNCPIIEKCTTGKRCVEESATTCAAIADGDYQSCTSCHVYISCKDGQTWLRRPCPFDNNGNQQVWTITGPTQGHCTSQSSTCNECPITPNPLPPVDCSTTGAHCISESSQSCRDRADGHYQACESCNIYHSCSGGVLWPNRQCPPTYYGGLNGRLVWVQVTPTEGRCDYTSTTCHGQGCSLLQEEETNFDTKKQYLDDELEELEEAIERLACRTGPNCIDGTAGSCPALDGDYQDCTSCAIFHSCSGGHVTPNRKCVNGLFWDATAKNAGDCQWISGSCTPCN